MAVIANPARLTGHAMAPAGQVARPAPAYLERAGRIYYLYGRLVARHLSLFYPPLRQPASVIAETCKRATG